ncbi:LacI family DNA-binding transcriptional regulator [Saccharopolyspora erythraea]|uniref:LacI family DNA-binding transcriptional regulator n=1 Tax=Saccharopolyspora erythraea TaxID=1836 RepID=UPI001BAC5FB0|nr:LacI family DNA-binding transcriptional regulator [Saccharopolyspora erythraea]QUH00717.1 LacI family DNA-binding transcriptional regulator [Saccharopolyspora erythraea]
MGIRIHDVAARAGVSVATASRALSGQRGVRAENREKVLAAARDLDYEPNSVAAALRSRTTHTVGMLVPRISNPFFATLVEAVERRLQLGQRSLLLTSSHYDPQAEQVQVRSLLDRRVDALVMIPCHRERSIGVMETAAARVPVVQLDLRVNGFAGTWVGVDSEAGIAEVVRHLGARGAGRLAFVGAEPTDSSSQERLDAYRRLAGDAVLLGDFSRDWGKEAAGRLLAAGTLPEGIVCGNDTIALGMLAEFARRGVRVPDDVRVTGFDDIPYAELGQPPLTTVRQPQEQMAAEAVRLLAAEDAPVQRIAIAPELVVRASG